MQFCDVADEIINIKTAERGADRAAIESRRHELITEQKRLLDLSARCEGIQVLAEKLNACQRELNQIGARLKDAPKTQMNMDELKRTIRFKLQIKPF